VSNSENVHYDELPAEVITADQLVALNMKLYRRAADITQEELGKRLGWTKANVSAAERSVSETRDRRRFDGITVTAIATALGLPIVALYLPPPDDGKGKRYLLRVGDGPAEQILSMRGAMWLAMHDRDGNSPALNAYRDRLREAYGFYLDPHWSESLADWLAANEDKKARADRAERIRARRRQLLEVAEELGDLAAAIDDTIGDDG